MSRSIHTNVAAIVAAVVAAASVIVPTAAARAESGGPLDQLRVLCTMKTGDFFVTPYQLARCQNTRSNKGFDTEHALCDQLGGDFVVSSEFSRNNRATWACNRA